MSGRDVGKGTASVCRRCSPLIAMLISVALGCLGLADAAAGQVRKTATSRQSVCRVAVIEGEVKAGEAFEGSIGGGLKIFLEPLASGWLLRVLPAQGPRGQHDYAELATPPYQSVSPLLISTDYSFRAQDALAWNPRHFRFAANRKLFEQLLRAYDEDFRIAKAGSATDAAARRAESELAGLVSRAPEGEFEILDAHLVQGTADQARAAAMVASHLNHSGHQVDQPADGRATSLGRINWLSFRIRLDLPAGFQADRSLRVERSPCL
jgi:hypothetical protein